MATTAQRIAALEEGMLLLAKGQADLLSFLQQKLEADAPAVTPRRSRGSVTVIADGPEPKARGRRSTRSKAATKSQAQEFVVNVSARGRVAADEDLGEFAEFLMTRLDKMPSTFGGICDMVTEYNSVAREAGIGTIKVQAVLKGQRLDRAASQRLRRLG